MQISQVVLESVNASTCDKPFDASVQYALACMSPKTRPSWYLSSREIDRSTSNDVGIIIIIVIIKSYYGAPPPLPRSASQHKLQLSEA